MIDIRPFETLGTFQNDWLKAHYHFSFSRLSRSRAHELGRAARVERRHDPAATPASTATATRTWRSSPTSAAARSPIATISATKAAPTPATSRSCGPAAASSTRSKTSKTSRRRSSSSGSSRTRPASRPAGRRRSFPEGRSLRLAGHAGLRPQEGHRRPAHPPGRSDPRRDPQARPIRAAHHGARPLPLPGPGPGPPDDQRQGRESA